MKIKKSTSVYVMITVVIIINIISHVLQNLFKIGNVYYYSYICWLILLFYTLVSLKNYKIKYVFITMLIILGLSTGTLLETIKYENAILDLHRVIFIAIAYFAIMNLKEKKIYATEFIRLCDIIIFLGIISLLYAFLFQRNYAIQVLMNNQVDWNSWFYTSFFSQRNIFGEFCFIASFASLFCFFKKRKIFYLFILILFGFNIYITNSRGAIISFILLVSITFFMFCNNRWILVTLIGIIGLFLLLNSDVISFLINKFSHQTELSIDSGSIRLLMWRDVIIDLFENKRLIFGHGVGAIERFLTSKYGVGSSHNMYIDYLFEGGIFYLSILLQTILVTFKKIYLNKDIVFRNIMLAAYISFLVYCLVEAGMALFASNFFSVTVTILFVMIPHGYYNND